MTEGRPRPQPESSLIQPPSREGLTGEQLKAIAGHKRGPQYRRQMLTQLPADLRDKMRPGHQNYDASYGLWDALIDQEMRSSKSEPLPAERRRTLAKQMYQEARAEVDITDQGLPLDNLTHHWLAKAVPPAERQPLKANKQNVKSGLVEPPGFERPEPTRTQTVRDQQPASKAGVPRPEPTDIDHRLFMRPEARGQYDDQGILLPSDTGRVNEPFPVPEPNAPDAFSRQWRAKNEPPAEPAATAPEASELARPASTTSAARLAAEPVIGPSGLIEPPGLAPRPAAPSFPPPAVDTSWGSQPTRMWQPREITVEEATMGTTGPTIRELLEKAGGTSREKSPHQGELRVLVLTDSKNASEELPRFLREQDPNLEVQASKMAYGEGLKGAANFNPDVVLIADTLEDPLAVAEEMDAALPEVPSTVLLPEENRAAAEEAMQHGARAALVGPERQEKLLEVVRRLGVEEAGRRRPGREPRPELESAEGTAETTTIAAPAPAAPPEANVSSPAGLETAGQVEALTTPSANLQTEFKEGETVYNIFGEPVTIARNFALNYGGEVDQNLITIRAQVGNVPATQAVNRSFVSKIKPDQWPAAFGKVRNGDTIVLSNGTKYKVIQNERGSTVIAKDPQTGHERILSRIDVSRVEPLPRGVQGVLNRFFGPKQQPQTAETIASETATAEAIANAAEDDYVRQAVLKGADAETARAYFNSPNYDPSKLPQ